MTSADVVVVGAGIAGVAVTYELSRRGVDVALIDGVGPGTGTTSASYGLANAFAKEPRDYFALSLAAMAEYERLVADLPHDKWLHRGGSINPADYFPDRDIEGDPTDALKLAVDQMISWGYPVNLIDARTVRAELEPGIDLGDPDLPVWHFPLEFCVDAVPLAKLLFAQAAARGTTGHFGSEVKAVQRIGRWFLVTLRDDSVISTGAVVNCAGPAADKVSQMLGSGIRLRESTIGMTALVGPIDHSLRHSVVSTNIELRPAGSDFVRLHSGGTDALLVAGGHDRAELSRELFAQGSKVMPTLASAHVFSSHAGKRPAPCDGMPSVGQIPGTDRCYELITHSAVTLAPLLARLLATEIVDETVDPLMDQIRPGRFAHRSKPTPRPEEAR